MEIAEGPDEIVEDKFRKDELFCGSPRLHSVEFLRKRASSMRFPSFMGQERPTMTFLAKEGPTWRRRATSARESIFCIFKRFVEKLTRKFVARPRVFTSLAISPV